MNIDFQPRPASPSSLRNRRLPRPGRGALRAGVYPDPVGALSFSSSFSRSSLPLCAHTGTPTTPVPSTIYVITRGHPRVGGIQPRRSSSVNSVHGACPGPVGALKPTHSSMQTNPFNAKPCTPTLTPLSATLTKKQRGGPDHPGLSGHPSKDEHSSLPTSKPSTPEPAAAAAFQLCPHQPKSFIRNAYEKHGGGWQPLELAVWGHPPEKGRFSRSPFEP